MHSINLDPWIHGWSKSLLLNRRNQFSTVGTVGVWLPYASTSKRWHQADLFKWKQKSIAYRKLRFVSSNKKYVIQSYLSKLEYLQVVERQYFVCHRHFHEDYYYQKRNGAFLWKCGFSLILKSKVVYLRPFLSSLPLPEF